MTETWATVSLEPQYWAASPRVFYVHQMTSRESTKVHILNNLSEKLLLLWNKIQAYLKNKWKQTYVFKMVNLPSRCTPLIPQIFVIW